MELKCLNEIDVIEDITGPTPWESLVVVVPKNIGGVQICITMKKANEAIQKIKHLIAAMDDLITDLNPADYLSQHPHYKPK